VLQCYTHIDILVLLVSLLNVYVLLLHYVLCATGEALDTNQSDMVDGSTGVRSKDAAAKTGFLSLTVSASHNSKRFHSIHKRCAAGTTMLCNSAHLMCKMLHHLYFGIRYTDTVIEHTTTTVYTDAVL
jgi:hypothetical protein